MDVEGGQQEQQQEQEEAKPVLEKSVVKAVTKFAKSLGKKRRKAGVPPGLATSSSLSSFGVLDSPKIHAKVSSLAAKHNGFSVLHRVSFGLSLDASAPETDRSLVVAGTGDGRAYLLTIPTPGPEEEGEVQVVGSELKGHSGPILAVDALPDASVVFTASADGSARMWTRGDGGKYKKTHLHKDHKGAVTGISVHPLGSMYATASADGSIILRDVPSGSTLGTGLASSPINDMAFHPDGVIIASAGDDGSVDVWNVTLMTPVVSLDPPGADSGSSPRPACTRIAFSQLGYILAAGYADGSVLLFDLRFQVLARVLPPAAAAPVSVLSFDESGRYLAVGSGSGIALYTHIDPAEDDAPETGASLDAATLLVSLGVEADVTASLFAEHAAGITIATQTSLVQACTQG